MKKPKPARVAPFSLRTCLAFSLALGGMHATAQQPAPAVANPAERPETYIVKPGESLSAIAKRFGIDPRDLAEWNGIADPRRIRVGQKLRLSPAWPANRLPAGTLPAQPQAATPPTPGAASTPITPSEAQKRPAQPQAAKPPTPGAASTPIAPSEAQKRPAQPQAAKPPTAGAASTPITPSEAQKRSAKPQAAKPPTPDAASTPSTPSEVRDQGPKAAGELEQLRATTSSLIVLLLQQGIISREKAEELMQQAQLGPLPPGVVTRAAPPAPSAGETAAAEAVPRASTTPEAPPAPATQTAQAEPGVVRVPYVPEVVKNEIRDQVKEEVIAQAKAERWAEPSALPEWLDRISFAGDLRLRYQGDYYSPDNTPALTYNAITGADLGNTTQDQDLLRYMARLRMLAKLSESWFGEIGLASGNTLNPVSTNQSMGNYFNRGFITIDRAYLRWSPSERWVVSAGLMPNPFFSTNLVWDDDLAFEGLVGTFKPRFNDSLSGFFTAGAFLVEHETATPPTPDPQNKWLYGLQAGGDWQWSRAGRLRAGLAYYPYTHIEGIPNTTLNSQVNDWTVPAFRQKGNTLFNIDADSNPATTLYALASKFQILNLTAQLDLAYFDPYLVRITADYATNLGFDQAEILARTGLTLDENTQAYSLGLVVGKEALNNFGDWQAFFTYKYLHDNSVLDAFNDSDFHLGGTDATGYIVGGSLALDRRVWLRLRWLSADEIDGPPLAIDVLQFDLNARF